MTRKPLLRRAPLVWYYALLTTKAYRAVNKYARPAAGDEIDAAGRAMAAALYADPGDWL